MRCQVQLLSGIADLVRHVLIEFTKVRAKRAPGRHLSDFYIATPVPGKMGSVANDDLLTFDLDQTLQPAPLVQR